MTEPRTYRVIATTQLLNDTSAAEVTLTLAQRLRLPAGKLEPLVGRKPFTLRRGLSAERAQALRENIEQAGLACRLEEEAQAPLPEVPEQEPSSAPAAHPADTSPARFDCPKCRFSAPLDGKMVNGRVCPACGVEVEKFRALAAPHAPATAGSGKKAPAPPPPQGESALVKESALPRWVFKWMKWGLTALGALLLLHTGVSVFEMPTYEVLYTITESERIDARHPRVRHYPELMQALQERPGMDLSLKAFKLDLVNAGMRPQPQTVVRLNLPPETEFAVPPVFLNAGRNPRTVQVRRGAVVTSYALGPLQPFDHVVMHLKLLLAKDEEVSAADLLQEVAVAKGEAQPGEFPKTTVITRILLGFMGADPKDSLEMLSDVFLDRVTDKDLEINREFEHSGADLAVSVTADGVSSASSSGGGPRLAPYRLNIVCENRGPGDAPDVTLTYRIPEGATLMQHAMNIDDYQPTMAELAQEFKASRGKSSSQLPPGCSETEEGSFTCSIKSLQPGRSARVFLMLRPNRAGSAACYASVSSARRDPAPDNNDRAVTVTIPQ